MKIFIYGSVGMQGGSGKSIVSNERRNQMKLKSFIFIQQAFARYQGLTQLFLQFTLT